MPVEGSNSKPCAPALLTTSLLVGLLVPMPNPVLVRRICSEPEIDQIACPVLSMV